MFSIRSLVRAVPKSTFRPATVRSFSAVPRTSPFRSAYTAISRPAYRTFTTSPYRWEAAGQVDTELSAKIEHELSLELEEQDADVLPENLQDFVENGGFEIQDTPGSEEVILTKQFGNESIKVAFSIADLNALNEDDVDPYGEDPAQEDEYDDDLTPQSNGPRSKGTINAGNTPDGNIKIAPEDRVAPADRPELTDNEDYAEDQGLGEGFPVRVNVTITKPNGGALQLETVISDGVVEIENVYHFQTGELADAQSAEQDFKRKDLYAGPPFENLDEQLQLLFSRYLEERGIDAALAQFIPSYIDFKEQKEYVKWLDNVKGFVDA